MHDELDWDVQFAYNTNIFGEGRTFGRKSYKEILLVRFSCRPEESQFVDYGHTGAGSAADTGELSLYSFAPTSQRKEIFFHLGWYPRDCQTHGGEDTKRAAIIDFQHPTINYFLAIKELKIHGDIYRRRTDIVGLVKGIPLLFVELKKNTVDVQNAYTDNYNDYLNTISNLFYLNALLMLSNSIEAKVGTLDSKYEFFHKWKHLDEKEQGSIALETV